MQKFIHQKGGDLVIVARSKDKLERLKTELELQYDMEVMVISKDLGLPEAPKEIVYTDKLRLVTFNHLS